MVTQPPPWAACSNAVPTSATPAEAGRGEGVLVFSSCIPLQLWSDLLQSFTLQGFLHPYQLLSLLFPPEYILFG